MDSVTDQLIGLFADHFYSMFTSPPTSRLDCSSLVLHRQLRRLLLDARILHARGLSGHTSPHGRRQLRRCSDLTAYIGDSSVLDHCQRRWRLSYTLTCQTIYIKYKYIFTPTDHRAAYAISLSLLIFLQSSYIFTSCTTRSTYLYCMIIVHTRSTYLYCRIIIQVIGSPGARTSPSIN